MKEIEIYVKSSALGKTGIHWRNASKEEQPPEVPEILLKRFVPKKDGNLGTIEYLTEDTKPYLLLIVEEKQIFLEITGIKASLTRSEKLGREVFDIVAWVAQRNDINENKIKNLAVFTLLNFWEGSSQLTNTISCAVKFDGLDAFKVEKDKIEELFTIGEQKAMQLLEKPDGINIQKQSLCSNCEKKINSEAEARELASQIWHDSFPKSSSEFAIVIDAKKTNSLNFSFKFFREPSNSPDKEVVSNEKKTTNQHQKNIFQRQLRTEDLAILCVGILMGIFLGILISIIFLEAKLPLKSQPTTPHHLNSHPPSQSNQLPKPNKAQSNQITCLQVPPCLIE